MSGFNLIKLKNNINKINDYNSFFKKMKQIDSYTNFEKLKIKDIEDKFIPYNKWVKTLKNKEKIIKDEINNIDNIYVSELNWEKDFEILTDFKRKNKYRSTFYGVCDNASQIIKYYYDKLNNNKKYFIVMIPVFKNNQNKYGWRWKKWGELYRYSKSKL